ncbi:hypothetical protein ACFXPE_06945 [Streptomyces scopuliridis]|uniref:hypothetical protein n=1 Tax=Streptomyces scopuliridis TaxID=452529 RepID=UPI00367D539B
MALLAVFFCTAAGSPAHVHEVAHASASAHHSTEADHGPEAPAPHQPGDHCSREQVSPSWTGSERLPSVNTAMDRAADTDAGHGPAASPAAGPPRSPSPVAQSRLCLWRI